VKLLFDENLSQRLFCWFPSSGLGTHGVKLLLHVSFTRLAGKLELPDRVPKLELGKSIRISKALFRREEEYEMDVWAVKYASRRSRIRDF
jgi:hypothetical protein